MAMSNMHHLLGAASAICLAAVVAAGPALAGKVFLTGHDPDFHAQPGAGSGGDLLQTGISFVTNGTYNQAGFKFLWVESTIPVPGGHLRGEDSLSNALSLTLGVNYDRVDGAGFSALSDAQLSSYTAIAIASTFGGTLTGAELAALNARADDIADFVNAGGGLFASAECFPCGANLAGSAAGLFGFVPVVVTSIGANPPFSVTAFGASLGLTDADVNDPTHNSFGLVGGLNVVDTDAAGNATTLAGDVRIDDGTFVPTPEPGTFALLVGGLIALGARARRRGRG
jgi:hypothetical protein